MKKINGWHKHLNQVLPLPYGPQQEGPHEGLLGTLHNLGNANKTDNVDQCDVNAHWPVDCTRLPVMANHRGDFSNHFQREIHDD